MTIRFDADGIKPFVGDLHGFFRFLDESSCVAYLLVQILGIESKRKRRPKTEKQANAKEEKKNELNMCRALFPHLLTGGKYNNNKTAERFVFLGPIILLIGFAYSLFYSFYSHCIV